VGASTVFWTRRRLRESYADCLTDGLLGMVKAWNSWVCWMSRRWSCFTFFLQLSLTFLRFLFAFFSVQCHISPFGFVMSCVHRYIHSYNYST
jgi:hypothetical protein